MATHGPDLSTLRNIPQLHIPRVCTHTDVSALEDNQTIRLLVRWHARSTEYTHPNSPRDRCDGILRANIHQSRDFRVVSGPQVHGRAEPHSQHILSRPIHKVQIEIVLSGAHSVSIIISQRTTKKWNNLLAKTAHLTLCTALWRLAALAFEAQTSD